MTIKELKTASHETMSILLERGVEVRKVEMIKEYDSILHNPSLSLEYLEQTVLHYQNAVDSLEEHKKRFGDRLKPNKPQ